MSKRPPVRLNTRVSAEVNDWLDKKSEEMAVSKSALVAFAVEQYRKETEGIRMMGQLDQLGIIGQLGQLGIADQLAKMGIKKEDPRQ